MTESLMPGFTPRYVRANGIRLHVRTAGAHSKFGVPMFEIESKEKVSQVGVSQGMYYSPVGGGILLIETLATLGKTQLPKQLACWLDGLR